MTKDNPAWSYHEIDASHSPNVTAPEALAAVIHFLASDDADFITGQTISVSGGLTMHG